MNHQQVRDIAEAAFKSRFGDIGIVSINVKSASTTTTTPWWTFASSTTPMSSG